MLRSARKNRLTSAAGHATFPGNAGAAWRRIVVVATMLPALLAALAWAQDDPAADSYYVQGAGDGAVQVLSPTGALPGFLPVPVPPAGGSFTYRVIVAAKPDGSRDVSVTPVEAPPPNLAPTATFKVTVLAVGCRLEGDEAAAGTATLAAELNEGGGTFRGDVPAHLAFAFVLPTGDTVEVQTLSIQAHAGVVETVVSTPPAAAAPQDRGPGFPAPEPSPVVLPFDLIALTSVADIGIDEPVWGYGLGIAIRLDPYDDVHAHVILRWRCFSTSILEEFASPYGGGEGSVGVGADGEGTPEGGSGGGSLTTVVQRTRIEFCLVDIGFGFDVSIASWLWLGVQITAGWVQGDVRGDRFFQTGGVSLSAPAAGGMFSVGWSAVFTDDNLTVGGEPLGTVGAWTAGWQVRF
jgi:hypothetical protein